MNSARKTFSKSDTGSVNKMLRIMQVIFIVYGENALIAVRATILDKTVEKIAYLGALAFFLNFVTDRFFPPPLPLEAMLLGLLKKAGSLSISRKQL